MITKYLKQNEGKGSAVISAIEKVSGEYVLIQDADLEYSPKDYQRLFEPINQNADAVYGSRFTGSDAKEFFIFLTELQILLLLLL